MSFVQRQCPHCHTMVWVAPMQSEALCRVCQQTFALAPSPTPPPPSAAAGRRGGGGRATKIIVVVLVVMGVVLALAVGTCVVGARWLGTKAAVTQQAKVKGHLRSQGGALGDFTVPLTSCRSGKPYGFRGVDFFTTGDERPRLRFLIDPVRGKLLTVTIPGTDRTIVLDTKACKILSGEVTEYGYAGGRTALWAIDGQVRFDCTHSRRAGHVAGAATFQDCF